MLNIGAYLDGLKGRRIGILGFGVSNAPVAELVWEAGAHVTVYDQKSAAELGPAAENLAARGVAFRSGDGYADKLDDEIVFRSPGFLPTHPCLRRAAAGRRPTSARFCTPSAQHLRIFGCFSSFQKIMEKL